MNKEEDAREPGVRSSEDSGTYERLCDMGGLPRPALPLGLDPNREFAILENRYKWMNGTLIHYYLAPSADGDAAQQQVVRDAFARWKALGIGLNFKEVSNPLEAELRVVFDYDYGRSSSYIGTYNLKVRHPEPTMRFGWDLTTDWGGATALHEIGHAIGLKHEHQNPNAGIVWNEPEVLSAYKRSQGWDEATIRRNILDKLDPGDITASDWDVLSVMHYPIAAGLILDPAQYRTRPTPRNTGFSERDITFIRTVYPSEAAQPLTIHPMELAPLALAGGEQADLALVPDGSRDYEVRTVGRSDARIVVFERRDGELHFVAADDDSAEERNASLRLRLVPGREYLAKVRLHSAYGGEGFGLMMV